MGSRHMAHGRRDGTGREATKPQVTGSFGPRPLTEGGEDCAQGMARGARSNHRALARIDQRDHAIVLTLLEHKVLTTDQIKSLYFRSLRRCQHRLKEPRDLGLVASFTPRRGFGEGRPPDCLLLTKGGLSAIAQAKGVRASDLSWIPDEGYRDSQNLAHRLGVNAFFCALIEAYRIHEGHCLATWRAESWVLTKAAQVKPDGFGRYLHPGGGLRVLPGVRPRDGGDRRPLAKARGLPAARRWLDGGGEPHRLSEPPLHSAGGGARGGGRLGTWPGDPANSQPYTAG